VSTRTHQAGYVLDTDPARLDLDTVERWLAQESYWATGRERTVIARSLAGSTVYRWMQLTTRVIGRPDTPFPAKARV
jgi:hypothetical protein